MLSGTDRAVGFCHEIKKGVECIVWVLRSLQTTELPTSSCSD